MNEPDAATGVAALFERAPSPIVERIHRLWPAMMMVIALVVTAAWTVFLGYLAFIVVARML